MPANTHLVHRGRREIAASQADCYYINTQLNGEWHLESSAAMTVQTGTASSEPATRNLAQVSRIKRSIGQHCARHEFDLSECAMRVGLSVGYVQQLLAGSGERFGAIVLDARLSEDACRLSDPDDRHLPVSTIAYAAGFADISHFGRAFRERYGQSPGRWRQRKAVSN